MQKTSGKKRIAAAVCGAVFALCLLCFAPQYTQASANSAQRYWEGKTEAGVCVMDGECPLQVLHEDLTFNIPGPSADENKDGAYEHKDGAYVTATYTFYNPADYEVTARLAFPFGVFPYYWGRDDELYDPARYAVTVNGEPTDCALRHTYSAQGERFSVEEDLPRLQDDFVTRGIFAPDATVWQYTYRFVTGLPVSDSKYSCRAEAEFASDTCVQFLRYSWYEKLADTYKVGLYTDDGEKVTVISVGKPLHSLTWRLYKNDEQGEPISGSVQLVQSDSMPFKEYVLGSYAKDCGISEVDFFNAVTDRFTTIGKRREAFWAADIGKI